MSKLECAKCHMIIEGENDNKAVLNLVKHQGGSECFVQRGWNVLPPRTPGYVSQKDEKTKEVKEWQLN